MDRRFPAAVPFLWSSQPTNPRAILGTRFELKTPLRYREPHSKKFERQRQTSELDTISSISHQIVPTVHQSSSSNNLTNHEVYYAYSICSVPILSRFCRGHSHSSASYQGMWCSVVSSSSSKDYIFLWWHAQASVYRTRRGSVGGQYSRRNGFHSDSIGGVLGGCRSLGCVSSSCTVCVYVTAT